MANSSQSPDPSQEWSNLPGPPLMQQVAPPQATNYRPLFAMPDNMANLFPGVPQDPDFAESDSPIQIQPVTQEPNLQVPKTSDEGSQENSTQKKKRKYVKKIPDAEPRKIKRNQRFGKADLVDFLEAKAEIPDFHLCTKCVVNHLIPLLGVRNFPGLLPEFTWEISSMSMKERRILAFYFGIDLNRFRSTGRKQNGHQHVHIGDRSEISIRLPDARFILQLSLKLAIRTNNERVTTSATTTSVTHHHNPATNVIGGASLNKTHDNQTSIQSTTQNFAYPQFSDLPIPDSFQFANIDTAQSQKFDEILRSMEGPAQENSITRSINPNMQ